MRRSWSHITALMATSWLAASCGNAGDASKVACSLCGTTNDLRGSISTRTGSQAQMQGWVVAAFELDSGIARVSEVDGAGLYSLSHVRTDLPQTMALFSPDYILQAVTSLPAKDPKTIEMYTYFQNPNIPKLINDGPIITFESLDGLGEHKKLASAQKGNGVPDGYVQITGQTNLTDEALAAAPQPTVRLKKNPAETKARKAWLRSLELADGGLGGGFGLDAVPDTNHDGIPNDKDPDIDGDGIINWLDEDDNGNGVLDVFDRDQNGDLIDDLTPVGHNTDQWFKEGIEYLAVQYELIPKADGSGNQAFLKFNTKVRGDTTPTAIQIRGAPSLLNGATFPQKDSTGNITPTAWNRLLNDDGNSEDGAAGDRVFGQKVLLLDGKVPRPNEVVFFELVFGTPAAPWYVDYAWTFPHVTPAAITAAYDGNTKTVLLVGNPFGAIQDFVWTIQVFDSTGKQPVWASGSLLGSTRQFKIPDNIVVPGQTYKFSASAQSLDKVPGIPAYIVFTPQYPLK